MRNSDASRAPACPPVASFGVSAVRVPERFRYGAVATCAARGRVTLVGLSADRASMLFLRMAASAASPSFV
jgi:hypothetical protein